MHAQTRLGKQFHEETFVLDRQRCATDFDITQLIGKFGYAPAAQSLDILPHGGHHAESRHVLGLKDREERLEVGKITYQDQCRSRHEHAAQTPQAKGVAQGQCQSLDIALLGAYKGIGVTGRAGNVGVSQAHPLGSARRSRSKHDVGDVSLMDRCRLDIRLAALVEVYFVK